MTDVEVAMSGRVAVARPADDIDAANAEEVRLLLAAAVDEHCETLIVDLCGVSYVDSAGIDMLFRLVALLADRRTRVRVAIADGTPLRRLAEIVTLSDVVPVDGSVEAAMTAAEGRDPGPSGGAAR